MTASFVGTHYNLSSFVGSNIAIDDFIITKGGGFASDLILKTVDIASTPESSVAKAKGQDLPVNISSSLARDRGIMSIGNA